MQEVFYALPNSNSGETNASLGRLARCVHRFLVIKTGAFSLPGTMTFDRPKTGQRSTIKLSDETIEAARKYFGGNVPGFGNLWRPNLSEQDMSTRAISKRIKELGKNIAIDNLSPNDLRHTWATNAAQNTPLDLLIYLGGWTSVSSALQYIEKAKIAIWK